MPTKSTQRKFMLGAELDPAQSAGFVLGDQLFHLGPASPVP
jgi:hypothetical protein